MIFIAIALDLISALLLAEFVLGMIRYERTRKRMWWLGL